VSRVVLTADQVAAMRAHGEETYPNECCGFLVGERSAGGGADGPGAGDRLVVRELARASNARADSPHNRYLIPPEEFARVQRDADRRGLDVVGFYHSHPDAPARPSEYDREHAWPAYAYLVLAVVRGKAGEVGAFELSDDRAAFTSIEWSADGANP
jgi:proteasome lid subunit RPN8/RPN11